MLTRTLPAPVRRDLARAIRLGKEIVALREEQQVATELGRLLRATSFERWLCSEALDSLVAEASATLMELSGDQYQLDRNDRNDLVVIDYEDAGAQRPVHTLSGGETFQASLALDKDRMVGLITHVPALAERVPVRFVVSRDGSGSSLVKERA